MQNYSELRQKENVGNVRYRPDCWTTSRRCDEDSIAHLTCHFTQKEDKRNTDNAFTGDIGLWSTFSVLCLRVFVNNTSKHVSYRRAFKNFIRKSECVAGSAGA